MRSVLLSTLNTCMPFIEYTWIYTIFLVLSFLVWADGKERWFPRGWEWKRAGETLWSVHMNPTGGFNCSRMPLLTQMLLMGTCSTHLGLVFMSVEDAEEVKHIGWKLPHVPVVLSDSTVWWNCLWKGKSLLCALRTWLIINIFERVSYFLCILTWLQCFSKSSQIIKIYIHKCSKNNSSQK